MTASPAQDELVRCRRVSRTFGTGENAVVALHDVTCTVQPRARVAITGPSGSGKTTLIHLIAGLDRPTAGEITWPAFDHEPRADSALVGVVFQGDSLVPTLTAVENVALPLVLRGLDDTQARERALSAMRRLELDVLAGQLPDELSGGQSQRVALARVLAAKPRLIVADEPTGRLDQVAVRHVVETMLETADEIDAALVISTHDPHVSSQLRDQWRLRDGALHVVGAGDGPTAPGDVRGPVG